jgi:peroxiredoxin
MPYITTSDGVELHVRERGDGPPIVIVPGWGCTTRYFERQLEGLSRHARVVVLDPRGQGESEKTRRGQRMGRVAHDVHDVLKALDLHDVTLLGWSLGASVVLHHVELFGRERVARIGLIGGGARLINRRGWTDGFVDPAAADAWRAGLEEQFATVAGGIVPQFFHRPPPPDELELLTAETLKTAPADGAAAMTWDCINQDFVDLLPFVAQPALVVLGRHDTIVPVGNAEVFAQIPDVRIEIFEDSGHAPFIEEPGRFNDLVLDFTAVPVA